MILFNNSIKQNFWGGFSLRKDPSKNLRLNDWKK